MKINDDMLTEWDEEVWRVIPGWEAYEVSSHGRVRRIETGYILSQNKDKDGYLRLNLSCGGRRKGWRVHMLVLLAFEGPMPPDKTEVAHWDGDVSNNWLTNLRYATGAENCHDKRRYGRMPAGETSDKAKLTDAMALQILAERTAGAQIMQLVAKYGVSKATICRVIYAQRRYTWIKEKHHG